MSTELEQKLSELRAKRAALAEERAKQEAERALVEQIEAEERALRDDEAIAAAEAEHGPVGKRIAVVHTDLGVIIVKRPNPLIFRRFQDKGTTKTEDFDQLVRPCLVYPSKTEFDRILEELPATLIRAANAVCALAGVRHDEISGK
jgi:hypothetical protein